MSKKVDQFLKIQVGEISKKVNSSVYCQLCGKEILRYGGEAEKYQYEIKEEAHIECIRKYQEEMKQRYLEDQKQSSKP